MARGRMLNRKVATSAKVGELGDALGVEAMLIHHRLIAFLDVNGVCRADAFWMKAEIVPKVSGINPEFCRKVSVEMERIGLVRLFEVDGLEYLHMPGFRDEQVGLRPDKETPEHPFPQRVTRSVKNPERIRKVSGKKSGEVEVEVTATTKATTTTSSSLRSSAPKSGAGNPPDPDPDVGNSVAIGPVIRPDLNQQPERVSGGEILAAWIDQQPARPSNRDAAKFGAACKRLAEEHPAQEIGAAMVGMGQLYPHSNGQPWDPLDLERKFAKALAASQQHPDVQDARAGAEFDRILNERELVR